MALNLIRYGRFTNGAPESATGNIGANDARACVFDPLTQNVWIVGGGFVGGKSGSANASVRMTVYEADSNKNPDTRLGYMSSVTASTQMLGGGDGTHYTTTVEHSDNGPTDDGIMGRSGKQLAIDLLSGSNAMRHSMVAAAGIPSASNKQFYDRTAPGNPPPSDFGTGYSASVQGHITAYLTAYVNESPRRPGNRSPSGTINETAPTFTADFRDNNGSYGPVSGDGVDTGDQMAQYHFQLRAVGSTTLLWNTTYTASSAEKAADAISRAYGGSTLTRGTQYEYRVRTSDQFGAWYAWDDTDWVQFTPANLGFVTLDSDPTGKIEDNTPDFKGRWTHQSSTTMKTVQSRLLTPSGTVLQLGADYNIADVASAASPGTLFTVPWANTGFTDLPWGTSFLYQTRGYDGTQWSDWSASRSFSTDAAPSIPSSLSPANGSIFTAFPLTSSSMSDSDDTTATGLTMTRRFTRPDTTTVDVTPTYNATTGKWEFQTTGTELNQYGTYSWKDIGYDGTLYSGEATSLGSGTFSASNTFTYAQGPTVTIDEPDTADTITSASFSVDWTTTGQVKYKVAIYPTGETTPIYESNGGAWTVSATGSHTVPSGYVRNGETYDVTVTVENATPLQGSDTNTAILIDYTAPTAVANFQVTPVAIGTDPVPTANRLSWDQTAYTSPEFLESTVYRRASGGVDEAEIILARITDPSVVSLIDYTPASGYEYTYGIRVVILTGLDEVESDLVEASATVALETTVLSLVGNGGTYRTNLTNVRERPDERTISEAVYQPLNRAEPTTVRGRTRYYTASLTAELIDTADGTARQHREQLDALDAQNGTVCMRYGDGTKRFVKIANLSFAPQLGGHITASFTARTEFHREGTL